MRVEEANDRIRQREERMGSLISSTTTPTVPWPPKGGHRQLDEDSFLCLLVYFFVTKIEYGNIFTSSM